jgi:peptidylprolyl isomerase
LLFINNAAFDTICRNCRDQNRADSRAHLINSGQDNLELEYAMKCSVLILSLAACAIAASAQTSPKPAGASASAKPATTAPHSATSGVKLPPGVPPVKGIVRTIFTVSLRYQDIKIGTGALAEPNKLYKVFYTGWRAADGVKFDSTDDHPRPPLKDKDGKPVLGDDGKPKLSDVQPMPFPQGRGGTISGFDQGFTGMRIGGKRRLFIPWQMAYGTRDIPDRGPGHPGIPPKSNLIFDVELVDVTDIPAPANHPGMGGMPGGRPMPGGMAPRPGAGNGIVPPSPVKPVAPTTPAAPGAPGTAAPTTPQPSPATAPTPGAAPSTPAAPSTAPATPTPPPSK